MTTSEKITLVQTLLGNDTDATNALVSTYLEIARSSMLNRLYPFGIPREVADVPPRYEVLQCELARNYFLRRGGEGETAHSENGISRTYGSATDEELLSRIVPMAKVDR